MDPTLEKWFRKIDRRLARMEKMIERMRDAGTKPRGKSRPARAAQTRIRVSRHL